MNKLSATRRAALKFGAASALLAAAGLKPIPTRAQAPGRVVVVGGGYGGATAARYLRLWSGGALDVVLVERDPAFVSCPLSNLVLAGSRTIADITVGYGHLRDAGVLVVQDEVTAVDAAKKTVTLQKGQALTYDRLVLAPGIDFMFDEVAGLAAAQERAQIPHAWKAGPQTVALRQQLEAMRDGGVFAIAIPRAPFRCPPAPYERICQVAWYLKNAKPKSKIIVLDANEDIQSEKAQFVALWNGPYKGLVEYRNNSEVKEVDAATRTAITDFGDKTPADVLNVIPPQRAGEIARKAGVVNINNRWCLVDWLTLESTTVPGVHVLGDSLLPAPLMPKSGHMANQHGKVAAAAIIELMAGRQPSHAPMMSNTCYTFIDDKSAMHIASVHAYDPQEKTMQVVPGSGGVSAAPSALEGGYGFAWAKNIWRDMLG